jgi:hypothetical protein
MEGGAGLGFRATDSRELLPSWSRQDGVHRDCGALSVEHHLRAVPPGVGWKRGLEPTSVDVGDELDVRRTRAL